MVFNDRYGAVKIQITIDESKLPHGFAGVEARKLLHAMLTKVTGAMCGIVDNFVMFFNFPDGAGYATLYYLKIADALKQTGEEIGAVYQDVDRGLVDLEEILSNERRRLQTLKDGEDSLNQFIDGLDLSPLDDL